MRMPVNSHKNPVRFSQIFIDVEKTGEKLKHISKEKGYGVRDLMTITGFSSQAIYKWFNGRPLPSTDTLVVLSKVFDTEIIELLVVDGEFDYVQIQHKFTDQSPEHKGRNIKIKLENYA